MTAKVEVVAHSVGPNGIQICTMLCEYPRCIHGELMTHRVFSRNASSSRAIPFKTQVRLLEENMFVPLKFQKRHSGMQGSSYFEGWRDSLLRKLWRVAGNTAIASAKRLDRLGVTKQLTNRILEPFSHIKVVITSTEWNNFFTLRDHKDAEIHIQELAREMKKAFDKSTPVKLEAGQWHLPFIDFREDVSIAEHPVDWMKWIKVSVARCARTSYLNNFGKKDINADMKLYEQLIVNDPKHASPCEHQAQAINDNGNILEISLGDPTLLPDLLPDGIELKITNKETSLWSGNFRGWIQYRKTIPNENVK